MSIIFTGDITFKNKLFNVLRKNESGTKKALGSEDTAYVLTAPGSTNSGWTFGYIQYDLSTGNTDGIDLFKDILMNAVDTNGQYIIDDGDPTTDRAHDTKVKELLSKAQLKGGLGVTGGLTTDDVTSITQALSSTYGKGEIDGSLDAALQKLVEYADAAKNAASQTDQTFLEKDIARLFLCDYANQFGLDRNPWIKFVQGGSFNGYIKNGTLGVDDLLNAYFRTKEAQKYDPVKNYLGANTVLKRFATVVQEAGGYTPTDLEEAKGVLRAYTYLYVPHESQLLATQARINNLNDFRRLVTKPANDLVLSQWKPEWGPAPTGTYDDLLMGDDKANMSASGDYQLYGRDGNDIIFGEGGNDHIEGGKGDDILLGGTGHDTYIYSIGDGNDRIIDEDKDGKIVIFDSNGTEINRRILGNFYKSGENEWKLPDGSTIKVTQNSPTTVVLPDGSTIELGDNFQDGDFGIHLLDVPDNPQTNNTIVGDLSPLDFDPDAEGIQSRIDEWGNVIIDPGNPDPNKEDILYDTTGNDRIEGKGGDDYIEAKRGGDEWLLGGDGRDIINSWNSTGTDIIEGGADSDIIYAGAGDDNVFTEDYGEMETLIADGETATSINEQGDLATGNIGNDFIYGSNAADLLYGGEGHDLIVGGGGDDAIVGDDDYSLATRNWSFSVSVSGNEYTLVTNQISYQRSAFSGDDTIYAGTGNDFVNGNGGNDEIYAGAGDDIVFGSEGDDFIDGGDGIDILVGDGLHVPVSEHGNDYIDGGSGNDRIEGGAGSDDLFGDDGNDVIYGDADYIDVSAHGDDYIDGEAGDDKLYGYGGNDTIFGGEGNDWLQGDAGNDYLDGEAGNDTILGGDGDDELFGSDGNDLLQGDAGNDYIEGGLGDDVIDGGDGTNEIYGGAGNDQIYGGAGNDTIDGGIGNDYMQGDAGNNVYRFGRGSEQDTIYNYDSTNIQIDTVEFTEGITKDDLDFIYEGSNLKVAIKGTNDSLTIQNWFAGNYFKVDQFKFADGMVLTSSDIEMQGFKVYGTAGNDILYGSAAYKNEIYGYDGIDQIWGGVGNDYIDGGSGDDIILSGDGMDEIYGGAGNDKIFSFAGDDTIDGGIGEDMMYGSGGNDTYIVDNPRDIVIENSNEGIDTVQSLITYTLGANVENLTLAGTAMISGTGNELDNVLTGNSGNNTLNGREGNDELYGGAGNDRLYGGAGDDILICGAGDDGICGSGAGDGGLCGSGINGGDGNDQIWGGDGKDTLFGGKGDDRLYGGDGNDWLQGADWLDEAGNDYLDGGAGNDTLLGQAGNDILIGGTGRDDLYGGEGDDIYFYHAGDGNDRIIDNQGDNTIVVIEANGDIRVIGNVYKNGTIWTTPDGKIQFTHNSPWEIVLPDSSTINLGDNFRDGDFGIQGKIQGKNDLILQGVA
jgi:Ca2+-binding RTX toxin-like protein